MDGFDMKKLIEYMKRSIIKCLFQILNVYFRSFVKVGIHEGTDKYWFLSRSMLMSMLIFLWNRMYSDNSILSLISTDLYFTTTVPKRDLFHRIRNIRIEKEQNFQELRQEPVSQSKEQNTQPSMKSRLKYSFQRRDESPYFAWSERCCSGYFRLSLVIMVILKLFIYASVCAPSVLISHC